jgi:hypothetical protein
MNSNLITSQHLESMVRSRYTSVSRSKLLQNSAVHNNRVLLAYVLDIWGGGPLALHDPLLHTLKRLDFNSGLGNTRCTVDLMCSTLHTHVLQCLEPEHGYAGLTRTRQFLRGTNDALRSWENLYWNKRNIKVPVTKVNHCNSRIIKTSSTKSTFYYMTSITYDQSQLAGMNFCVEQ